MLYHMEHLQFFLSLPGWKNSYKTTKSTQTQGSSFQELIMKRSKRNGPWDFKLENPCKYEDRLEKKQKKKESVQIVSVTHKKILTVERKHKNTEFGQNFSPKSVLVRQQMVPREKTPPKCEIQGNSFRIPIYLINKKSTQPGNVINVVCVRKPSLILPPFINMR